MRIVTGVLPIERHLDTVLHLLKFIRIKITTSCEATIKRNGSNAMKLFMSRQTRFFLLVDDRGR